MTIKKTPKLHKKILIPFIAILFFLMLFSFYVNDYYRADTISIQTLTSESSIQPVTLENGTIVYAPEHATKGFIFYPGGKVEYTAYEPLLQKLAAENQVLCVLVKMPFNLAVLDINAADGICDLFPEIEHWYLGGHSLGGSMAAAYLENHTADFDGLILLASYSTADLSDTNLQILSIYGSEDQVLNSEKYDSCKKNLPADVTEIIIPGGCHAYFGVYGKQEGDGIPAIRNEEQISISAKEIGFFLSSS